MLFNILAFCSVITVITLLRKLVNIFPSMVACLIRWKECVNLEYSTKQSHDRNIIALTMIVPFCLTAYRFNLYSPSFFGGLGENLRIGLIFGIFFAYFLVRILFSSLARAFTEKKKAYVTADKTSYTFFVILALMLLTIGGVLSFFNVGEDIIRNAMLWVSVLIYAISLMRKFHIFSTGFSILTSFLYLCALEIIPTGLLIVSALIF